MKKLFIVLAVIVIGGLAIYFLDDGENKTPDFRAQKSEDEVFKPDPSNATFIFEDGPITLSGGKATQTVSPDSGFLEEISLTKVQDLGDINEDNRDDAVVLIERIGGGSGQFFYIAAFVSSGSSFKGTNAFYVGDRISPQSVDVSNGIITLKYLDRSAEEPFAASPTIPASKEFAFRSGTLVER
ncbi:MAG: hypothetical protein Q8P71_01145 [bacterium]|nr:hypothetical protein [bacterium]